MTFLETRPTPVDSVDVGGTWAAFRVESTRERAALLRSMVTQELLLTVGLAGDTGVPAHLWSCDPDSGALTLRMARADDRAPLQALLHRQAQGEQAPHALWAATYLGDAKLQFDLPDARAGDAAGHPVLFATRPRHLLKLPRRSAVRVPHRLRQAPMAHFSHPLAPDQRMSLRVLDIGRGGCALWRPSGTIPLARGLQIRQVEVELDEQSIFFTDLRIVGVSRGQSQMQTMPLGEAEGLRLGCAWLDMPAQARQTLEAWLRRGRLRRSRAALDDLMLERISLD